MLSCGKQGGIGAIITRMLTENMAFEQTRPAAHRTVLRMSTR